MTWNKKLKLGLIGVFVGIIYSTIYPLIEPGYLHFIPEISTTYSFLFGIISGVILICASLVIQKRNLLFPWILLSFLYSVHYFFWIYFETEIQADNLNFTVIISTIGILLGTYAIGIVLSRLKILNNLFLCSLLVVVTILSKYFTLYYIPINQVKNRVHIKNPKSASTQKNPNLLKFIYPLSEPIESNIHYYQSILPAIPPGKKFFVIVLDAFREDYVAKSMNGIELTPNMEKFKEKYHYFSQYRTQAPWTKPSTASLFTGKYLTEHSTYLGDKFGREQLKKLDIFRKFNEGSNIFGHILSDDFNTLAERFKKKEFKNAGMVTIPHISRNYNFNQGFEIYLNQPGLRNHDDLHIFRTMLFWLFRERPRDSFLYMHMEGPHYPFLEGKSNTRFWKKTSYWKDNEIHLKKWRIPKIPHLFSKGFNDDNPLEKYPYEIEFLRSLYASDVNYYDRLIFKNIKNSLKNIGIFNSSVFVVTSDHGEGLMDHESVLAHGKNLYEEIIRVPLFMKFPKNSKYNSSNANQLKNLNLETIDLTATLLDYARADQKNISGKSFLPALKNSSNISQDNFSFSLSQNPGIQSVNSTAIVKDNWKYIYSYGGGSGELYNLKNDPSENNPIDQRKQKKYELRTLIHKTVGTDSSYNRPAKMAVIKRATEGEINDLKGLGYLE